MRPSKLPFDDFKTVSHIGHHRTWFVSVTDVGPYLFAMTVVHRQCALLLQHFHWQEPHRWTRYCLTDRLCIGRIGLAALLIGFDISSRQEPNFMAKLSARVPNGVTCCTPRYLRHRAGALRRKAKLGLDATLCGRQPCAPCPHHKPSETLDGIKAERRNLYQVALLWS